MTDLNNILNNGEPLSDEDLMRYLQGNLTDEERFAVEKQMADSAFINEAVEGLQHFDDPAQVQDYVHQLNSQLQKHTAKKVHRKAKRKMRDDNWLVFAILAILSLCVAGYLLIHFIHIRK